MTETNEGYQGWANYETWNIVLWLGNDEGLYRSLRRDRARLRTPEAVREYVLDLLPKGTPDFDSPADYDKVDWAEVLGYVEED